MTYDSRGDSPKLAQVMREDFERSKREDEYWLFALDGVPQCELRYDGDRCALVAGHETEHYSGPGTRIWRLPRNAKVVRVALRIAEPLGSEWIMQDVVVRHFKQPARARFVMHVPARRSFSDWLHNRPAKRVPVPITVEAAVFER